MRAIQVSRFGGPEVLEYVDIDEPVPTGSELLVRVSGAGINFADTHQADDSYLSSTNLPFVPGMEVVGFQQKPDGDAQRVCGFVTAGGAYAEFALTSPEMSFLVPDALSDSAALSLLVQGLTAHHLIHTSAKLRPAESIVIHAAAGGVGSLSVQIARTAGAGRIIATASTQAKLDLAVSLGADVGVLLTGTETAREINGALRAANNGQPVDVVLEMVGGPSFEGSLKALSGFGRLVTFGSASRAETPPIDPHQLLIGSRSVVGFWLVDCMTADRVGPMIADVLRSLVLDVVQGRLTPLEGHVYPLADARHAHEDLRARLTTGKVVLDPRLVSAGQGVVV